MTTLPGGFIRLIDSPIRYMQARAASGPPRLFSALVPVVLEAVVVAGIGWVFQSRMLPTAALTGALTGTFILFGGFVTSLLFLSIHAGAVIMLDMLTAQSRQARRYLELCALAYWPPVLVSILQLVAMWLYFDPPPVVFSPGDAAAAAAYGEDVARMPFSILTGTVDQFADVWLIALHACTLRVVAGISVGGTWGAGVALAAVLLGVPWFAGQVMVRLFL